ncbi:uncharacterized protein LOC112197550 isoform X2 [Rosa chinensis]|uniref:uncharacterized protein LOC112197550 isoform X2 n=1 Tax=Rosa chinensis TaxID=74649 RepID=UPI001AD90E51|nr:uncharacterized protein LOC112197550 isoform X2 [Rosa chinensis]
MMNTCLLSKCSNSKQICFSFFFFSSLWEEPAHEVEGPFESRLQTSHPLPEGLGAQVIALFTSTFREPKKIDNKIPPKVQATTPAKWAQSAPTQERTNISGDVLRKDQKDVTHTPENNATATPTIINTNLVPYVTLHLAALNGDWMTARNFLQLQPEAVRAKITKGSETALHIAAGAKRTLFVEELVKWMTPNDLELKNDVGNTALYFAAVSGIKRIAEVMVDINPRLPQIRGTKDLTPLHMATLLGHKEIVWYLYDKTILTEQDYIGLLISAITADLYALDIIQKHPEMAFARDRNGETALHVLARKPSACYSGSQLGSLKRWITSYVAMDIVEQHPEMISVQDEIVETTLQIVEPSACYSGNQLGLWKRLILSVPNIQVSYDKKLNHMQATELVKLLWKKVLTLGSDLGINDLINVPSRLLFTAAELGNIEFLIILIRSYPSLIWQVDEQNRSIFHAALIHRQEKVFNLIYELGGLKDLIASYKDVNNNNMLHLAARASPNRLSFDTGAALKLRRELTWFKEVEKIVQPLYKEMRNSDGETPQLLFTKEHKELLRQGEEWMKGTASSCMVVATLIATVMFSVFSTVPGGNNNNTGIPIFLKSRAFKVFVISDSISLISSTTSILSFLSILTSRYTEGDFLNSLPYRLIVGLATLFISMATMMMTFVATLLMVLGPGFHEIKFPVALVAAVPVGFYALLQFPLLSDMICHAYISRVSFRPCNHLLH